MTVKDHYDSHLGNFYSWMVGDFKEKQQEQESFFRKNHIFPKKTRRAIDLGAGHGLQSVSLARLGFSVTAVDFNKQLLTELKINKGDYDINVVEDELLNFLQHDNSKADVIVCMGDTITHLKDRHVVEKLIERISDHLEGDGRVILSFRELIRPLEGLQRFVPVKSDSDKILTCFLEYFDDHVTVHDILNVREHGGWVQKISAYPKLQLSGEFILEMFKKNNLRLEKSENIQRMLYLVASKMPERP